ncbi:uncharacterized protein LOC128200962 [Galleria mellonella]|uniref:Uncharacterized protein LOC128200962 n=1 Tax=Galleria mellonella TaxID=7137 RepID=A0ABM3MLK0_GALME|nr:uncharacterized protein LOC128200962 [Galleria mellonella]
MQLTVKFVLLLLLLEAVVSEASCLNDNCTVNFEENETKVLSRRKRYLIFPDGSSFQLVLCVQTAAVIPIGDIFLYGNTAALAWSLPSDPSFLYMLKKYDKEALRRGDIVNSVNYLDENGHIIAKVPYKRKQIVNPAFAKRSVDEQITYKEKLKTKIDRMSMHGKQLTRDYLKKDHLDDSTVEFHRNSRVELFEKLEKLFTALGQDGRQCVLYKLCEAAQFAPEQGTFLQEFLRVIFTLPKGKGFSSEQHRDYDQAHLPTNDCATLYPGCYDFELKI